MAYTVIVRDTPRRYLDRLPSNQRGRIVRRLDRLADDPRPADAIPLTGTGAALWRVRVGPWRVLYAIDDARRVVDVQRVAPRGEAYRDL